MNKEILDFGVITEYLRLYGLELMGDAVKCAERLNRYFIDKATSENIQLAQCTECSYYSDAKLDQCPFCGDREGIIDIDTDPKSVKLAILNPGEGLVSPVNVEEIDHLEKPIYSEKDLDKIVDEIRVCSRMAAEQIYRVGKLITTIKDLNLWKCRLDARGKHKYSGLYDCIEQETGIKKAYAHRLLGVVREFSEDQLKEYGVTRLAFAVRVPEDRRTDFLEEAKQTKTEGKNLKNLVEKVNQSPKKKEKKTTILKEVTAIENIKVEPQPELEPEEVKQAEQSQATRRTITNIKTTDIELGRRMVPMWVKPKGHARVNQPTSPAMSITDLPWFAIPISPDVFLSVKTKVNQKGEIEAIVEFREGRT